MNKLLGFFELRRSGLPCVKWVKFEPSMVLDSKYLWTVRTAIQRGNDFNLPRKVGVDSSEAYEAALNIYNQIKDQGMVVVYPYFIAEKSGILEVGNNRIIIEAVNKDLWNLVTESKKDVTIYESSEKSFIEGNKDFLSIHEYEILKKQATKVKQIFRSILSEGKSVMLEWSFAHDTDINNKPIGEEYLVFYEARAI